MRRDRLLEVVAVYDHPVVLRRTRLLLRKGFRKDHLQRVHLSTISSGYEPQAPLILAASDRDRLRLHRHDRKRDIKGYHKEHRWDKLLMVPFP